jgi:predicted ATPase
MFEGHPMSGSTQRQYITTELDNQLLSSLFDVQTNWHVIAGAPSCGKTTLIDLLAAEGYRTIPEWAREHMEQEIARGRTIEEVHADGAALQRRIFDEQLIIERGLQPNEIVFLDGAVPGSLAWHRVFGLNPNDILADCFHHRYASVFILDRLPHQLDGLRFEDERISDFLDGWFARDYAALGYDPVRIPALPPVERLDFLLEKLSGLALI